MGSVVEWFERMFNWCFREGRVPKEWISACTMPLYKGKGECSECSNYRGIIKFPTCGYCMYAISYRGISWLGVADKVNGGILMVTQYVYGW